MKKLRRLCIYPNKDTEPKMHMLYECNGKNGTTASTMLWFLEPPVKGIHEVFVAFFCIKQKIGE